MVVSLNEELRSLEGVTCGTLPNGFSYSVMKNGKPKQRCELKLVVKAGSILETDEESGVAHLVEHLAFRSTRQFQGTYETVRFLESLGVRFGACVNAATRFEETVYGLCTPTDCPSLLERCLEVMAEWAFGLCVSEEDVEAEKKIILEEWRQAQSCSSLRTAEAYSCCLHHNSKYASRSPIGFMDVLQNVDHKVVRAFYDRWYQPCNMAIVIVGDFESEEQVLSAIEAAFGKQPLARDPVPVEVKEDFFHHTTPIVSVYEDTEESETRLYIDCKRPTQKLKVVKDFRRQLLENLFHLCFASRLQKLAYSPDSPFLEAHTFLSFGCSLMETFSFNATLKGHPRSTMACFDLFWAEIARIRKFGFLPSEVASAKKKILADFEAQVRGQEHRDSSYLAELLEENFVFGDPVVRPRDLVSLGSLLLSELSEADISSCCENFSLAQNCVVFVSRPASSARAREEEEEELLSRCADLAAGGLREAELFQWEDWEELHLCLDLEPAPIRSRKDFGDIRATEVVFENGLRCCFKAVESAGDQVCFRAEAMGGMSELPRTSLIAGRMAATLAQELGELGVPKEHLQPFLAGKRLSVGTRILKYSRAVLGEASAADLEDALKLVHFLFTSKVSCDDPERLRGRIDHVRDQVASLFRDPQQHFSCKMSEINTSGNYYHMPTTLADLDRLDVHEALAFYNDCFQRPSEFTFVFCGGLEVEAAISLAARYLGTIPSPKPAAGAGRRKERERRASLTPLTFSFPSSEVEAELRLPMAHPIATTALTFPVTLRGTPSSILWDSLNLAWLTWLLREALTHRLRFCLGGVYSVSVDLDFSMTPSFAPLPTHATVSVLFSCDPSEEGCRALRDEVLAELARLRCTGFSPESIRNLKEFDRRQAETQAHNHFHWLDSLLSSYRSPRFGGSVEEAHLEFERAEQAALRALSPETSMLLFRRFFPEEAPKTLVTMLPA